MLEEKTKNIDNVLFEDLFQFAMKQIDLSGQSINKVMAAWALNQDKKNNRDRVLLSEKRNTQAQIIYIANLVALFCFNSVIIRAMVFEDNNSKFQFDSLEQEVSSRFLSRTPFELTQAEKKITDINIAIIEKSKRFSKSVCYKFLCWIINQSIIHTDTGIDIQPFDEVISAYFAKKQKGRVLQYDERTAQFVSQYYFSKTLRNNFNLPKILSVLINPLTKIRV